MTSSLIQASKYGHNGDFFFMHYKHIITPLLEMLSPIKTFSVKKKLNSNGQISYLAFIQIAWQLKIGLIFLWSSIDIYSTAILSVHMTDIEYYIEILYLNDVDRLENNLWNRWYKTSEILGSYCFCPPKENY